MSSPDSAALLQLARQHGAIANFTDMIIFDVAQLEAFVADLRARLAFAGAHGSAEDAWFAAEADHNCPLCGGSGHVDDTAPATQSAESAAINSVATNAHGTGASADIDDWSLETGEGDATV